MPTYQNGFEKLPKSVQQTLMEIIKRAKPRELILFGSRSRGDHRENSDFDLALKGRSCSEDEWNLLLVELHEEPFTLYNIDLVEFERLNKDYQANITQEGHTLYG